MVTDVSEWQDVLRHIPGLLFVAFRIGGMFFWGPVFSSPMIPVNIRMMLAFILAAATYPLLSVSTFAGMDLELELLTLAPLVALELLIGIAIGYMASLPLLAVQTGGLVIGQQMGLGFARFYNPAVDDEADVLGQMMFFVALAGFLAIGGHEQLIVAVLRTFSYIEPGVTIVDLDLIAIVNGLLLSAFEVALRIAAPVLAIIFLQSTAMGFMAKTVPQLNILSLGFPMRILVGTTIVLLGLVVVSEVMLDIIVLTLDTIFDWVTSHGAEV